MSDERQFQIRITTPADTSGATQAAKALNQSGDGAKYFNVHGREMHRLINEMDRILPGTGELLRLAFRPETLGIAATVLIIQQIVSHIKKYREEQEKLIEESLKSRTDVWEAQQKALSDCAEVAKKYSAELVRIGKNTDDLAGKEKLELEVLKAQIALREKLAGKDEAKKEFEGAEGEKRRIALLKDFRDAARMREEQAGAHYVEAGRQKDAQTPVEAAAAVHYKGRAEDDRRARDAAQRLVDEDNASGQTPDFLRQNAEILRGQKMEEEALQEEAKAEVAERHQAALKEAIAQQTADTKAVALHEQAVKNLAEEVERAKSELGKATKSSQKANADVIEAETMRKQGRQSEVELAVQSVGARPGYVPAQSIMRGILDEETVARGGKVDAGQMLELQHVMSALRATGNADNQIIAIVKTLMTLHISREQKFKDMAQALHITKAQMAQMMAPTGS